MRVAWLAVMFAACGSRSALDGAPDAVAPAHDAQSPVGVVVPDVVEASVPLPTRTCAKPGEWVIPLGGGEGSNLDIGATGSIVATVQGQPPQNHCHSGPTVGNGGCAVLVIDATSDILLERRFACGENWNFSRRALATADAGFVLAAGVSKGSDMGTGPLAADALVVARYASDGSPVYVRTFPPQGSAMCTAVQASGDTIVVYAKAYDTLTIERLDASGVSGASRSFPVQLADNIDVRLAMLDGGDIVIGGNTTSPVDWGDSTPDASALVVLDPSLATKRVVHTHDFIQFASLKAFGAGFSYSGVSTMCTLDLGGGSLGCPGGEADEFVARFTDESTLAFARKLPCAPTLNADSCVDGNQTFAWMARADSACNIEGAAVHGGYFAEVGPTGGDIGAVALPYEFGRSLACDSPLTRVIGGTLEHTANVGPATLPAGGFILRIDVSSLL